MDTCVKRLCAVVVLSVSAATLMTPAMASPEPSVQSTAQSTGDAGTEKNEPTAQQPSTNLAKQFPLSYTAQKVDQGKTLRYTPDQKSFPAGTQFIVGDTSSMSGWKVRVDKDTGRVEVDVDTTVGGGSKATLRVRATYSDGTYNDTESVVEVNKKPEQQQAPASTPPPPRPIVTEKPYDLGPTFIQASKPPPIEQKTIEPKETFTPHPVEQEKKNYTFIKLIIIASVLAIVGLIVMLVRFNVRRFKKEREELEAERSAEAVDEDVEAKNEGTK